MQYTQNVCIFSLENRNTSESRENHKTVDLKVTLLKLEQVGRWDGNVSAPFVLGLCHEEAAYLIDEG